MDADGDGQFDFSQHFLYDDRWLATGSRPGFAAGRVDDVLLDFTDADGQGPGSSDLDKRYLHGPAIDQLLAQESAAESLGTAARVLWQLTDNLASVRDLVDHSGAAAAHFAYDAYGNVTSASDGQGNPLSDPAAPSRYLYTSREHDTAAGLQYNRARWYDPPVGRWLSEDPIGFDAEDVNLFRYGGNSPLNVTDSTGLVREFLNEPESQLLGRLNRLIGQWRASDSAGWRLAADLLERFTTRKNTGTPGDIWDLSHRYAMEVKSYFADAARAYFGELAKRHSWPSAPTTLRMNVDGPPAYHSRFVTPWLKFRYLIDRYAVVNEPMFYALGGYDAYFSGILYIGCRKLSKSPYRDSEIGQSEVSWRFIGTMYVEDTFSFSPIDFLRSQFDDYLAARTLQFKHNYFPFEVRLTWRWELSGVEKWDT